MATTSPTLDRIPARSAASIHSSLLLQRIRAEFIEMPGLTLTLPQATRLWSLTVSQTERMLTELIESGLLVRDPRGCYRRRGCPRCS